VQFDVSVGAKAIMSKDDCIIRVFLKLEDPFPVSGPLSRNWIVKPCAKVEPLNAKSVNITPVSLRFMIRITIVFMG